MYRIGERPSGWATRCAPQIFSNKVRFVDMDNIRQSLPSGLGNQGVKLSFAHGVGRGKPGPAVPLPTGFRKNRNRALCHTESMQSPLQTATEAIDPKSVKVNLTTGSGVDIEWKDGHVSHYNFVYLRDACPCAMCEDERAKSGLRPGDPPKLPPGALPMFKPTAKPVNAEAVGKYAIKFSWND